MNYLYIFATVFFTVFGQMILKWRITNLGWHMVEGDWWVKIKCYCTLLFDPLILVGFFLAFIASVFWTMAMTKFEITVAYPFMSLSPAFVFLLGVFLLNESFSWGKITGLVLIIIGTIVTVKL